jgi:hypothetical protein
LTEKIYCSSSIYLFTRKFYLIKHGPKDLILLVNWRVKFNISLGLIYRLMNKNKPWACHINLLGLLNNNGPHEINSKGELFKGSLCSKIKPKPKCFNEVEVGTLSCGSTQEQVPPIPLALCDTRSARESFCSLVSADMAYIYHKYLATISLSSYGMFLYYSYNIL